MPNNKDNGNTHAISCTTNKTGIYNDTNPNNTNNNKTSIGPRIDLVDTDTCDDTINTPPSSYNGDEDTRINANHTMYTTTSNEYDTNTHTNTSNKTETTTHTNTTTKTDTHPHIVTDTNPYTNNTHKTTTTC